MKPMSFVMTYFTELWPAKIETYEYSQKTHNSQALEASLGKT